MSQEEKRKLKHKGQTLAEFALTLPILLLLVFGVVEFGRLFQAWVTIQNAAREATRYTTTGQYDEEKYILEEDIRDPNTGQVIDKGGLLPCWQQEDPGDPRTSRGQIFTITPSLGSDVTPYTVQIYAHPDPLIPSQLLHTGESLFATWYDGTDCDPGVPDHLEWRKDILRLASIYDVARRGAAGLSLEESRQTGTLEDIQEMLFGVWDEPMARIDQPGYFNVTVCSSRAMLDDFSTSYDPTIQSRFKTVGSDVEIPSGYPYSFEPPFCMLNEVRPPARPGQPDETLRNEGLRWMDPGGPGDRVTVFVTFNHPLITPLPLADYLTITARRSGVNESFRAARALSAVQGAPPGQGQPVDLPTMPATNTPIPTDTPTETPSLSPTPSNTPTPTIGPFSCDDLEFGQISFFGQRVYFEIINNNGKPSELQRVYLSWRTPSGHPGMYLAAQAFNAEIYWDGNQPTAPFDTATDLTGDDLDSFLNADRTAPGFGYRSYWEALYLNGGTNIAYSVDNNPTGLTEWDFAGSVFYFLNPDTGTQCEVRAPVPDPNNPTETPTVDVYASATFTPDCASSQIRMEFVAFRTFGVIELRVINNRYRPSPFLGFELNWPDHNQLPKIGGPNIFNLAQIRVGGSSVNDPESVAVWTGPDFQPSTTHNEGTWNPNYVFPQRSITSVFLDFDGVPGRLDQSIDFGLWMLSGRFDIGCYDHGTGGSGPGNIDSGSIFLDAPSPPPPTNTPRPTRTPGPTLTPSPTRPTNTPSRTPTPGPTNTPRPTNTATEEVLIPPTAVPTSSGTGGGR
ncbi:MAG: hypothetical protein CUN56_01965 [Phototrophicales bacterium]|nr:MAG: hypothetical protein CUN56_01965 [Phototrophicales bacterium]